MEHRNRSTKPYLYGILSWIVIAIAALKLGAVSDLDFDSVIQLRLPRVILATAVGAGLAVSGAVLQALFSNPLCDPYTLGISSGSALGAAIGISLGLDWMIAGLAGTSFVGAVVFMGILYLISVRQGTGNLRLLLAGVMLGFLGSGLLTLWIYVSEASGVQSALIWFFGDLSRARLAGATGCLVSVLGLCLTLWGSWRELDGLLMGEEGALVLGVSIVRVRRRIIVLTSLMIGLCVAASGMIGFVGLVVPHFARRSVGSLHLKLLPLCALLGAVALTAADVVSRTLIRPHELPVGVVTALIGAPVFLWVMLRSPMETR